MSTPPDKFAVAQTLREICGLLKIKGENKYRANAYDHAAAALEGTTEDLDVLISENRLTEVRNIGSSIAGVIKEVFETGTAGMLEKLKQQYPPGVLELAAIPGLSIKKIEALHEALGISSLDDLKKSCDLGVIRTVKGFSEKSEATIKEAIATYEHRSHQIRLVDALNFSDLLLKHMQKSSHVDSVTLGGQASRWEEVVNSIDIIASGSNPEKVLDHFEKFPYFIRVESREKDRSQARLTEAPVIINCYVCESDDFVACSHHWSGTTRYNERLAQIAADKGFHLSSFEMLKNSKKIKLHSDADIYKKLALPYIPIELREEPETLNDAMAGESFDDLIAIEDIRGMTHCHSTFSDGVASVEEMVRAVKKMGKEYITITDHSPTAHYAGGVVPDTLPDQWKEIAAAQEKVGIRVFRGTESDILGNGALDYPDEILEQLDVIIASIHSRMKMDEDQMTSRLVNCMQQKQFKIWGHALGRLVLKRDPIPCRVLEVLDVAAKSRVAIEVNGDPYRLDMEPRWLREARKRKMRFVISTDAHSTRDLENLDFGIHLARRAGVRKHEVLNTFSAEEFARAVKP